MATTVVCDGCGKVLGEDDKTYRVDVHTWGREPTNRSVESHDLCDDCAQPMVKLSKRQKVE